MKKNSLKSILLLAVSLILIIGSIVGTTTALPSAVSEDRIVDAQTKNVEVALVENGTTLADEGTLLDGMVGEDESVLLDKKYDEQLAVTNQGSVDEYVRVTIYKSWYYNGEKDTELDPSMIDLNLTGNWIEDTAASTEERTVLYLASPLAAGATSALFADGLTIKSDVANITGASATAGSSFFYWYDDCTFEVSAKVDAVQTHNAKEAVTSAWGESAASCLGL